MKEQTLLLVLVLGVITGYASIFVQNDNQLEFKTSAINIRRLITSESTNDQNRISLSLTGDPITPIDPPGSYVINSTIPINVVFLGFNESLIDISQINNSLTHWYAPVILTTLSSAGGNFTLDYNYFFSNTTTLETDFITYLSSIASLISPPVDLQSYDPSALSAYLYSASDTISWLDNNVNSYFGTINNSYCLYLIDTWTWRYVLDYYYYDFDMPDPDTGLESPENLTILFGGEYPNRGLFLDLSAGPVYYQEAETSEANEGVSDTTITPIWEYIFPQDTAKFNANLTEYIQETVDLVFTPSYLYKPVIKDEFELMIYILDNTSLGNVYANTLNYIDPTVITNSLEALIPSASWNISYYKNYLTNHPTLAQVVRDAYQATNQTNYPNAINPYQTVIDYLNNNRNEFGMTTETIPVFIFAWDEAFFFKREWVLGFAESDANGNALMVLSGYNPAFYPSFGYTNLVVHEVGHMMGLMHPHSAYSWDNLNDTGNYFVTDWLRDFVSTPMTYAHQDTTFSTFDYDSLDRGHTFERLNNSWHYLYSANKSLLEKGYLSLGGTLNTDLDWALQNHSLSLQFFDTLDFESAFYNANLSYLAAMDYYTYTNSLPLFIPALIAPIDGIILSDATPVLEWNPMSNAVEYRLILANNPQMSSPLINITASSTTFSPVSLPDGTYYWYVQGKDAFGNWGMWSAIHDFSIDTTPPSIILVSPTNKTYSTLTVWLNFTINEPTLWIRYSLDGDTNVSIAGNVLLTDLSKGTHYIVIFAEDSVNNIGVSTTLWFSIKTSSPSLSPGFTFVTIWLLLVPAILSLNRKKQR